MKNRWRFAWAWFVGAVLVLSVVACTPKPPPQPPPPPPPAVGPVFTEMLLRTCGTGQFCVGGRPIDFGGCEACCESWQFNGKEATGWPLYSTEWLEYVQAKGKCNVFHMRPGPFNVADEGEWTEYGGPYVEVDGKADLTQFNPKFWKRVEELIQYAGDHHAWVEVDLIDSWRLKNDCPYSAWNPARNIQGEDHCLTTHRGPGDGVHEGWLRQVIAVTGRFGNVIYQIGNEPNQVAGKNAGLKQWEHWVRDRVRFHEGDAGNGVVHMVGTNSEFDEIESASWIDYINRHSSVPTSPSYEKPTTNNELNPNPTEDSWLQQFCNARKNGAYFWLWRGGASTTLWEWILQASAEARATNCAGVETGACPFAVPKITVIRIKPLDFVRTGNDCTMASPCPQYDATPLVGGAQYCRKVGFTDGRQLCSVRQEGDSFRQPCEEKALGGDGYIQWSLTDRTGTLDIGVRGQGYKIFVYGHGTARVVCGAASQPGVDLCKTLDGGSLRVSR